MARTVVFNKKKTKPAPTRELERRYANVRAAMAEHSLDGLVVAGASTRASRGP